MCECVVWKPRRRTLVPGLGYPEISALAERKGQALLTVCAV